MYPFIDDYENLRKRNQLGGYNQPDYSPDGSSSDQSTYEDYLPSYSFNDPSQDELPTGLKPQFPEAADYFRRSLEPEQPEQPEKPKSLMEQDNTDNWVENYRKQYKPQLEAQNRLNALLNNFPTEESPSLARKLVASAAGIGGGYKAGQDILNQPYNRALERFKAQADPYLKAAENERQNNVNERTLLQQSMSTRQAEERIQQTERKNVAAAAAATTKNEIARFKAEHPNWIVNAKDGPNIIAYDPTNPRNTITLGPSNHLSDKEKIDAEGGWRVKAAEASGKSALDRAIQAGKNAVETKETVPGRAETPKDTETRIKETMSKIYFSNPEDQKFFSKAPDGSLTLRKGVSEGGILFGWSKEEVARYREIVDEIYGGVQPVKPSTKRSTSTPSQSSGSFDYSVPTNELTPPARRPGQSTTNPNIVPGQRTVVVSPDGKKMTIPMEQVQDFLRDPQYRGWKQIF